MADGKNRCQKPQCDGRSAHDPSQNISPIGTLACSCLISSIPNLMPV
jgi:hypothetical protein